ncbi:hypothetical protein Agub_g4306 [Astrephomene gubernaculifera]|uniref:C2H2-type domain-containing protein n=1 Tax=Astrephomene gubernaculifera TaxID=47775 RepID=A0AAD3DJX6_9CHLO|nr:hypothetical protein Agub_g4306 [Astrephomene gubernaculifera]
MSAYQGLVRMQRHTIGRHIATALLSSPCGIGANVGARACRAVVVVRSQNRSEATPTTSGSHRTARTESGSRTSSLRAADVHKSRESPVDFRPLTVDSHSSPYEDKDQAPPVGHLQDEGELPSTLRGPYGAGHMSATDVKNSVADVPAATRRRTLFTHDTESKEVTGISSRQGRRQRSKSSQKAKVALSPPQQASSSASSQTQPPALHDSDMSHSPSTSSPSSSSPCTTSASIPTDSPSPATPPSPSQKGSVRGTSHVKPASVYVLWDLDNKYPVTLDHASVVQDLRNQLQRFGQVAEITAFCNYQTLNHVPELWEEAQEMGMMHPLDHMHDEDELRCPLCGNKFKSEDKLERHFKQLHEREHGKRMRNSWAVKRYVKSEKFERYRNARNVVLPKRRGFGLEDILKLAGVAVQPVQMGPQKADVALEQHARGLLKMVQVQLPSPPAPAPADSSSSSSPPPAAPAPPPPPVLCLVSDDRGFAPLLKLFSQRGWVTVLVSVSEFGNPDWWLDWSAWWRMRED